MELRRFSQTMASEWQTAFVVSHKMPWCALLTAVKNYNKSLQKLQDFFFKTETKTKCSRPMIQDQDFHFCPRGASRPRPWSRGLHHCLCCTLVNMPSLMLFVKRCQSSVKTLPHSLKRCRNCRGLIANTLRV